MAPAVALMLPVSQGSVASKASSRRVSAGPLPGLGYCGPTGGVKAMVGDAQTLDPRDLGDAGDQGPSSAGRSSARGRRRPSLLARLQAAGLGGEPVIVEDELPSRALEDTLRLAREFDRPLPRDVSPRTAQPSDDIPTRPISREAWPLAEGELPVWMRVKRPRIWLQRLKVFSAWVLTIAVVAGIVGGAAVVLLGGPKGIDGLLAVLRL